MPENISISEKMPISERILQEPAVPVGIQVTLAQVELILNNILKQHHSMKAFKWQKLACKESVIMAMLQK